MKTRRQLSVMFFFCSSALWIVTACTHGAPVLFSANDHESKDTKMTTSPMRKVAIGRADILVPEGADVQMTGEVNEVQLTTAQLKAGESFQKLWSERVKSLAAGTGEQPGHTAIRKQYPASENSGQVYFEYGKDPEMLVVLERWQLLASTLVKGKVEFRPKYLTAVESSIETLFSGMSLGGQPAAGDFVVNSLIVHAAPNGGAESTDAAVKFNVPGRPGTEAVRMELTLRTKLLSTPGSITVLNRVRQTNEGSQAAGMRVETLRARTRTVGALRGEESAFRFEADDGTQESLRAEWGSPGVANDAFAPQTEMALRVLQGSHPDIRAALSEWDSTSSSLRFRK